MIIDAYIPTITYNSVDIRIICDSGEHLTIIVKSEFERIIFPSILKHDLYFFRCSLSGLKTDHEYTLRLFQKKENSLTFKIKTPDYLEGQKVCRFGILTDLHIAYNCINRHDSGKRLYGKALELAGKYIRRLKEQGAEFIIFPGDTLDPASKENMKLFSDLRNASGIPFYAVIGNHEAWGNGDEKKFNTMFCSGENGFYAFSKKNTRFIMLSTPRQSSLYQHTKQYSWLVRELDTYGHTVNVFIFLHFSFILHPCVQGFKNDGMQQLHNGSALLALFQKYKGIKAVFAGHKNIPSKVMVDGIAHVLSPQLIQAPCGYDIVDVFEHGLIRATYEIDEQDYLWQSRRAFGQGWRERYGEEEGRNFTLSF